MADLAITTQGLTRRFGRLTALENLDLNVARGNFCALLGPNGAGKSTTFRLLLGLLPPTAGEGQVLGTDLTAIRSELFQQVAYLADQTQLPGHVSASDYLAYLRPFYRTWDKELEQRLCERLLVPADRRLATLSRGNRQKVALISCLAFRPRLLLLDEPFAGIDVAVRDQIVDSVLASAGDQPMTVVLASHDLDEIERLVDQVVMLRKGRCYLQEPTEYLLNRFRRIRVRLREAPGAPPGDSSLTEDWIQWRQDGARLELVHSRFDPTGTEQELRQQLPGLEELSTEPMSLRDVVAAVSRPTRRAAPCL
ncbi:MAG: ABC transporter ATP-binding protein [Pseudomonadota bacterium]